MGGAGDIIGDVIPGPMLAHKAEEEGIAAVEIMAGQAGHVSYDCIPNVVYTWPEIATAGLAEHEVKATGRAYKTGKFPFTANGRARTMGDAAGFVKFVIDAATHEVLGCHMIGPNVSEKIGRAHV